METDRKVGMERAKELFLYYCGNQYYMDLDGDGDEYRSYRVPKEKEEEWRREYLDEFFRQERHGKEALGSYANAVYFLKSDRSDEDADRFLYYPLRTKGLDDATVLFMLRHSYRLAEKWMKKKKFPEEEKKAYLPVLDEYIREVQKRAEEGTVTRVEDYVLQEFADPAYAAVYLKELRQDWERL